MYGFQKKPILPHFMIKMAFFDPKWLIFEQFWIFVKISSSAFKAKKS